jgi:hypothetical protein
MTVDAPETLEVVLAFSSTEDYSMMGETIVAVRSKLDLPSWSTPTEIIAAALQAAL